MDPYTLGHRVYARLFNKHIAESKSLAGGSSTKTNNARNELDASSPQQSELNLRSGTKSLVFSRVRAMGTIVQQESVDVGGVKHNFIYIDDGTGVVPFVLNPDAKSEDEEMITEDIEQRLSAASHVHQALVGVTVEVMGKLCHRQNFCASRGTVETSKLPALWIECSHLTVKDDAMAETAATMDMISTYKIYFPEVFSTK
ncbi:hypothetical protein IWW50_004604 [Coemansia erecta]|nr:hypothetical protein IWW50_004604 [Coemansia erecta]